MGYKAIPAAHILCLALTIGSPSAMASERLGHDLQSLLDYAKRNNQQYAAMHLDAMAAQERISAAGALPDPVVRLERQYSTNNSTKYTLMQTLPFWGKRDLMRQSSQAEAQAVQAQAETTWSLVAARIKSTYGQYFALGQLLRINQEVIDLLDRLEKVGQSRYAAGLVTQQDALRAQIERSTMRSELMQMETDRHYLRARLNALLARPAHAPLAEPAAVRAMPAPAKLNPIDLEARLSQANPQLMSDEARVREATRLRDLSHRNRFPDITVGLSPMQTGNRINEWEWMLEMRIPLQQGSQRTLENDAHQKLEAALARQRATAIDLSSELSEHLAGLDTALRLEQFAQSSLLPQAEIGFKSAVAGYENGKLEFATLIDALRQIRKTRQDIIKAQAEQQNRLAEIERLIGEDL